jgi:hypothetical protein
MSPFTLAFTISRISRTAFVVNPLQVGQILRQCRAKAKGDVVRHAALTPAAALES